MHTLNTLSVGLIAKFIKYELAGPFHNITLKKLPKITIDNSEQLIKFTVNKKQFLYAYEEVCTFSDYLDGIFDEVMSGQYTLEFVKENSKVWQSGTYYYNVDNKDKLITVTERSSGKLVEVYTFNEFGKWWKDYYKRITNYEH